MLLEVWGSLRHLGGFPGGASGKESTCQGRRGGFDLWIGKIPWSSKWQPTAVFLPGESHGQRCLGDYSPWEYKESDTTERLSVHKAFWRPLNPFWKICLWRWLRTASVCWAPIPPGAALRVSPGSGRHLSLWSCRPVLPPSLCSLGARARWRRPSGCVNGDRWPQMRGE